MHVLTTKHYPYDFRSSVLADITNVAIQDILKYANYVEQYSTALLRQEDFFDF